MVERPPAAICMADPVGLNFLNLFAMPVDASIDWFDNGVASKQVAPRSTQKQKLTSQQIRLRKEG